MFCDVLNIPGHSRDDLGQPKIDLKIFEKNRKISKSWPQHHPKFHPCQHINFRFWWLDHVFGCSFKFPGWTMSQFSKIQHGFDRTYNLLMKIIHMRGWSEFLYSPILMKFIKFWKLKIKKKSASHHVNTNWKLKAHCFRHCNLQISSFSM